MCQELETGVARIDGEDRTMKVIRQIVYEADNQEALDHQLGRSLSDGDRVFTGHMPSSLIFGVLIKVSTLHDERVKVDEFPGETAKAIAGEPVEPVETFEPVPCQCVTCRRVRGRRDEQDASLSKAEQAEHEVFQVDMDALEARLIARYSPDRPEDKPAKPAGQAGGGDSGYEGEGSH